MTTITLVGDSTTIIMIIDMCITRWGGSVVGGHSVKQGVPSMIFDILHLQNERGGLPMSVLLSVCVCFV